MIPARQPDGATGRSAQRPRIRGRVVTLGLLMVMALALLVSVPGLHSVLDTIRAIKPIWIAAAVALELASDISYVVLFRLFFDRIPALDARLLAWTEQASGALLPAGGAGGLAVGGWLMHLAGASKGWIIRRSGGLFMLTSAVNGATVIGSGLALMGGAPGPRGFWLVEMPTALTTATVALGLAVPRAASSLERSPRWLDAIALWVPGLGGVLAFLRLRPRLIGGIKAGRHSHAP